MDRLESRCFDIENELDNVKKDVFSVRKENADLKDQMRQQDQRMQRVRSDLNDEEQYDRRWNLRVFNVKEPTGATAEDCGRKCCQIFTDLIGVGTTEADLEAAHRTGQHLDGRRRAIIVRFRSRKLRDKVLADRKKLKGKGVSVDEDLTAANSRLVREAFKHSFSLSSWSSKGKVFVKLKNGKTVRIIYGSDIDSLFKKEMPQGVK